MMRAHKIRLKPTREQVQHFRRACGTARFAWNWALSRWNRQYAAGEKPNEAALRRQLNAVKRQEFPWMLEVSKYVPAVAIMNLGKAFARFFAGLARRPKFKKKGRCRPAFYAGASDVIATDGRRVKLPKVGWVRMKRPLRFAGRLISATVSHEGGWWFVSLLVDMPWTPPARENQAPVGVDLGVHRLATCSNGLGFENARPLRGYLHRLRRVDRRMRRLPAGSKGRAKAQARLSRLHYRVRCIRQDALHQATTRLVRSASVLVLEDLNVRGLLCNRSLARAIADVGLYEFRRQTGYKAEQHGSVVLHADRWFASSKRCHACGQVLAELPLAVRVWQCTGCGTRHDRDDNAAANLAWWGSEYLRLGHSPRPSTARLAGIYAHGDRSSAAGIKPAAQPVADGEVRNLLWTPTGDSE